MSILVDQDTRVLVQGITGSAGRLPRQADARVRHAAGRRRHPGQGRHAVPGPASRSSTPSTEAVKADRRQRQRDLRAAAVRRRRDHGGRGRRHRRWSSPSPRASRCWTWSASKRLPAGHARRPADRPQLPGRHHPGRKCKIGIMPGHIHKPGRIGVVSRSGTLTYEAVYQLTQLGPRASRPRSASAATRSTAPTSSTASSCFNDDPETDAVIMIGEIGGSAEEDAAAEYIGKEFTKPVAGFIAGQTAPPGQADGPRRRDHLRRQGHRGGEDQGDGGGRRR